MMEDSISSVSMSSTISVPNASATKYISNGTDPKMILVPISKSLTNGSLMLAQASSNTNSNTNSLAGNNIITKDKIMVNVCESVSTTVGVSCTTTTLTLVAKNSAANMSNSTSGDGKFQSCLVVPAPAPPSIVTEVTTLNCSKAAIEPPSINSSSSISLMGPLQSTTTNVIAKVVSSIPSASGSNTNNRSNNNNNNSYTIQHNPTVLKTSADVTKQGVPLKQTPMNNITQLQKQQQGLRQKTYLLKNSVTSAASTSGTTNMLNSTPAFKVVPGPGGQTVYKPNFAPVRSDSITVTTSATKTVPITTMVKKNLTTVFIPASSSGGGASISISDRKIITTKALKPPRQLPPPSGYKVEPSDSCTLTDGCDAEVASITKDPVVVRKVKRKSQSPPLQLFCDERLDRSSPELWPENVPGVHKYISDVCDSTKGFRYGPITLMMKPVPRKPNGEEIIPKVVEDKKISIKRTLHMTPYGLLEEGNSNPSDTESAIKKQKIAKLLKSNNNLASMDTASLAGDEAGELELKGEPDNDFTLDPSKDIEYGFEKPKLRQTPPSSSSTTTSSSSSTASSLLQNNYSKKKVPEWQKNLAPDEVNRILSFGTLTAASLLDKVKEIQNYAFQVGLEEQSEMMRAKCLGVFSPGGPTFFDVGGVGNRMASNLGYHFIGENLGGFPPSDIEVNIGGVGGGGDDSKSNDAGGGDHNGDNVLPLVKRKAVMFSSAYIIGPS